MSEYMTPESGSTTCNIVEGSWSRTYDGNSNTGARLQEHSPPGRCTGRWFWGEPQKLVGFEIRSLAFDGGWFPPGDFYVDNTHWQSADGQWHEDATEWQNMTDGAFYDVMKNGPFEDCIGYRVQFMIEDSPIADPWILEARADIEPRCENPDGDPEDEICDEFGDYGPPQERIRCFDGVWNRMYEPCYCIECYDCTGPYDFYTIPNEQVNQIIVVDNPSNQDIQADISLTGHEYFTCSNCGNNITIPAGQSRNVSVRFRATQIGDYSANLVVSCDNCENGCDDIYWSIVFRGHCAEQQQTCDADGVTYQSGQTIPCGATNPNLDRCYEWQCVNGDWNRRGDCKPSCDPGVCCEGPTNCENFNGDETGCRDEPGCYWHPDTQECHNYQPSTPNCEDYIPEECPCAPDNCGEYDPDGLHPEGDCYFYPKYLWETEPTCHSTEQDFLSDNMVPIALGVGLLLLIMSK